MNKKIVIWTALAVIILLLAVVGGWTYKALIAGNENTEIPTPSVILPTVSDSVKVELTAKNDNKVVDIRISGIAGDIDTIEYELTYTTGSGLPRGVLGKITVEGQSSIERNDIDLGTCSRGKCVYDTGVTSINLSLKFNSVNGQSSVFQKTFPL